MLTDETIGSKVALYHLSKITGEATIEGQTACYWKLSNGQQFQKKLGYYFESYNKSKRVDVKFWTQDVDAEYQAHLEAQLVSAALSAQRSKLDDYLQYMRFNYLRRLSSAQIASILAVCQEQIGDLPRRAR